LFFQNKVDVSMYDIIIMIVLGH